MQLIKPDIARIGYRAVQLFCETYSIDINRLVDRQYIEQRVPPDQFHFWADAVDFYITAATAQRAQTFVFDSEQIMALSLQSTANLRPVTISRHSQK